MALSLQSYIQRANEAKLVTSAGRVADVVGLTIEATGPRMRVGDLCYVEPEDRLSRVPVEVLGFRGKRILLMPLGDVRGIAPGCPLIPTHRQQRIRVGPHMLGRVVNSLGHPLDGRTLMPGHDDIKLMNGAPKPLERTRITEPIVTGIRAIDGLITVGKGQRMGIMSGSGVGKSKLIGMIARNTNADVNIIALIGERGREVRDFVEQDLGEEGLARSVVVVATSDEPALMRIKGAYLATALAEYFRDRGLHVLMMMDSVTRFAMAQREIGLALGEPPTTKGYPPSVYAILPKLLERPGMQAHGSITGLYSVLVEQDDMNDPVGDAVRSILDGHIVLSRDIASRGHYPAIDVLNSISRVMLDVVPKSHQQLAQQVREAMAVYREAEDLINIGAYVEGSNPDIDRARQLRPRILQFLKQDLYERGAFEDIEQGMQFALGRR